MPKTGYTASKSPVFRSRSSIKVRESYIESLEDVQDQWRGNILEMMPLFPF